MATGRKGSTSKAGGVRFPDDDEPPGSPTRRDDRSEVSSLLAVREKDGSFLVKAGFLKSHHTYEVVFTLPEVPALGRELSTAPSSSPSRRTPNLRVQRIGATLEVAGFCKPQEVSMRALSVCSGGVKVTCEYRTHQEGVTQEDLTLVTKGRKDHSLKIRVQAKVIDPHHGTPMLQEGVRCLGPLLRRGSERKRT
ncbi:UPF0687 protein C20orf27 homolog isoform X1 [Oryzias latipes]|uniref:UPF0687 protein C20orf27 homolog isoform X1 n=1 Tax=Oryzias latipes TaxID=8090 RepID=UPI0009D98702|nr:UPF0687 protein C20orf27 homolog isoform X1 [Oryzias latipes]XP_020558067.1 UPF0687 protein C20orf27 homolog isoform X1 [Oryzias latipes]